MGTRSSILIYQKCKDSMILYGVEVIKRKDQSLHQGMGTLTSPVLTFYNYRFVSSISSSMTKQSRIHKSLKDRFVNPNISVCDTHKTLEILKC